MFHGFCLIHLLVLWTLYAFYGLAFFPSNLVRKYNIFKSNGWDIWLLRIEFEVAVVMNVRPGGPYTTGEG